MAYIKITRTAFNSLFTLKDDFLRFESEGSLSTTFYQSWGVSGKMTVDFKTGDISYYRSADI